MRLLRFFDDPQDGEARATHLRRAMALSALVLIAVTWRLWTPQTVFPQVPFFRWAAGLPAWCEWIGLAGMVLPLTAVGWSPGGRWGTRGLLIFAASTAGMVLLDQERLQPWAYQFMLMAVVLAVADARVALPLLRILIVSFYFHSALSKFDYTFLHTLGAQFLAALAGSFGGSVASWSEPWRLVAAAVFPVGELLIAVGLCFLRTRRLALGGAVLLHVLLLLILGPWGLNHKLGVLVWNVYFIWQDLVLFGGRRPTSSIVADGPAPVPQSTSTLGVLGFAQAVILAAVLLPFLAPTTWFDLWPSWGLYAASAERVSLLIHRRELEQLPGDLQAFAVPTDDADDPWIPLRLDRWALAALDAPIYPQSRYQLGVAEAVIVRYQLGNRARVVRFALANRWTGARQHEILAGMPQVLAAGEDYFFNTRPRQGEFRPVDELP